SDQKTLEDQAPIRVPTASRKTQKKSRNAAKGRVSQGGDDGPHRSHLEAKAHDVKQILQGCKAQGGAYRIDDAVHRFVEGPVPVCRKKYSQQLDRLLPQTHDEERDQKSRKPRSRRGKV